MLSYIRIMPFGFPDIFEVEPPAPKPSPWLTAPILFEADQYSPVPDTHKKEFAIEWAKIPGDPFKAACIVFKTDTTSALWASRNWILDPEVNAIKDAYVKSAIENEKLLDRDSLARKFLTVCDEKTKDGRPAIDAKDRLRALELYAKMMGYMDDSIIKNTITNNNTVNNKMEIVFVEPDQSVNDKLKAIENIKPVNDSEILEDPELELGIKLVG